MNDSTWHPDRLGGNYQCQTIRLAADFEGSRIASLVRLKGENSANAVLHLHGFADYFFQTAYAEYWQSQGYDFFAIDLPKYGRSLLSHQTPNQVTDLAEYFPILNQIVSELAAKYPQIIISGHSTGGLTAALWLAKNSIPEIKGLILNAPLFSLGTSKKVRYTGEIVKWLAKIRPLTNIPREVNGSYARSLHRDFEGEWDFDLALKPLPSFLVSAGWLNAINLGLKQLSLGLDLMVPSLVITSATSAKAKSATDPVSYQNDIVLDVVEVRKQVPNLGNLAKSVTVSGALHDVFLSKPEIRSQAFSLVTNWLATGLGKSELPKIQPLE